jgi:predicted dehydrogenase
MKLNISLVGTGNIVENGHVQAIGIAKSVQLWSVLSRDILRAKEFAQKHAACSPNPAHDQLKSLLSDPDLDAVIIATPDKLHCQQAVAAAEAGKHVLLEKPIATNLEDAQAIVDACERNGVILGLCYHLRWHDGHRKIVSQAHEGDFGELRHVRAMWAWHAPDNSNWRAGSELGRWWSLAGVGTHCLDLARWTLTPSCGEITKFSSTVSKERWGGPHDETALLSGCFESGATMELCSSVLFDAPTRFEIYGTKGFAICESTLGRKGAGRIWTNSGSVEFEVRSPFIGLLEDFCDAIMKKRAPEVAGAEACRNLEFLIRADPLDAG